MKKKKHEFFKDMNQKNQEDLKPMKFAGQALGLTAGVAILNAGLDLLD